MLKNIKTENNEEIMEKIEKTAKKAKSVDFNPKSKKGPQINSYCLKKNLDGTFKLKEKVIHLEIGKKKKILNLEKSPKTSKKYLKNSKTLKNAKTKKTINKEEIKKLFLNPFLSKSKNLKKSQNSLNSLNSLNFGNKIKSTNFLNFPAKEKNPIFQNFQKKKNFFENEKKINSVTSLKKSIYLPCSEIRISNFYKKMVEKKKKKKNLFSSQNKFLRRSVSLKRSRNIEENNELFNLNFQTEKILKNENEYFENFEKNLKKEKDFFFEILKNLKKKIFEEISNFENEFINLCENYKNEFYSNFEIFKNLVKNFKKSKFKFSENFENDNKIHTICKKLKITYFDSEKKKKKF